MWLALDTTLRSRGAGSARSCASTIALMKQRAQGKPGAHDTRSRAQKCTRRTAGAPEHPAFPAQWFYGLCRALVFGVSMDTLMRMQNSYDIAQARRRAGQIKVARFRKVGNYSASASNSPAMPAKARRAN